MRSPRSRASDPSFKWQGELSFREGPTTKQVLIRGPSAPNENESDRPTTGKTGPFTGTFQLIAVRLAGHSRVLISLGGKTLQDIRLNEPGDVVSIVFTGTADHIVCL